MENYSRYIWTGIFFENNLNGNLLFKKCLHCWSRFITEKREFIYTFFIPFFFFVIYHLFNFFSFLKVFLVKSPPDPTWLGDVMLLENRINFRLVRPLYDQRPLWLAWHGALSACQVKLAVRKWLCSLGSTVDNGIWNVIEFLYNFFFSLLLFCVFKTVGT